MKTLLAIVTAFFPIEQHSDEVGYCTHEIQESIQTRDVYLLHHWSQGWWYCDEATHEFFTKSTFQGEGHVARIRKWKYSWLDSPYVTLTDGPRDEEGCWTQ
jgi:hypothetical protein